ncbi:unnamed protein product [Orchesella dallaii]|uniref:G-protein coupled receptors family 1 profile domain-containing protein n=1 Tax=Orchesella dallaii TaxID=48710 RepID=A0ABP1S2H1_9HEXA
MTDHYQLTANLSFTGLRLAENISETEEASSPGVKVSTMDPTFSILNSSSFSSSSFSTSNSILSSDTPSLSSYQDSDDIWKHLIPSAAALISNSATAAVSTVSTSLFPTKQQESFNISGLDIAPDESSSVFMDHNIASSSGSRLSSTLSVHSGAPSSVFINSISTIATSTGGYWDSVLNASEDTVSPTTEDFDFDFTPEDELRVSMGVAILLCVAYGLVFIIGMVGNLFVLAVVFRTPRMRTPTNFFISNLAVADLLVVIFCLPATLNANIFSAWILGEWLCQFVSYLQGVSVSASIDTLIAIAIERYLAICHPMKCQISTRVCRILILIIWTFSFSISLPWAIYFRLTPLNPNIPDSELMVCTEEWPNAKLGNVYFAVAHLLFCYLLPLTLITICYTLILRKVSMRKIPQETKNLSTELLVQRSKMKVIKMLLLVVVLFAMSWLPLYSIFTRVKFGPQPSEWEDQLIRTITPIAQWLGSSNSCINPILYAFFNKKYRTGFKAVLMSRSCCSTLRVEVSASSKTDSSTRSSNRINLSSQIKNGSAALLSSSGSDRNHRTTERTTSIR